MLVANPDKLGALAIRVVSFVLCIAMTALTWAYRLSAQKFIRAATMKLRQ